jgi:hypothetical protein
LSPISRSLYKKEIIQKGEEDVGAPIKWPKKLVEEVQNTNIKI